MSLSVVRKTHSNLSAKELLDHALKRCEGEFAHNQAFCVSTGARTGRSPNDRFIVKDIQTCSTVDWGSVNQPIEYEKFKALWKKAKAYLADKEVFISHLHVGADAEHTIPVKVITEYAWHNLFVQNLFVRMSDHAFDHEQHWTMVNAAGLETSPETDGVNSDATIIINFTERKILLCGLRYAGEMKKAMFSVLNYCLTEKDILPMHCAANVGQAGDVALFFGLSGTGKTTLSSDPERFLIGDDEHGWSADGVFNFEGGCYAKCIDLSPEREPVIWNAIRHGAIMENVVLEGAQNTPNFSDGRLSKNSRAAYPREHIEQRVESNSASHPHAVIFLTCDLYGVLPPVSLLDKYQAAYHFLSGYTALVGSTEVGSIEMIEPTFSACFGAPFFPRPYQTYADLLMKRLDETGAQVYLVNTGWTGGPYGVGERFSIPTTRGIIRAILSGKLEKTPTRTMPGFGIQVPNRVKGMDSALLNPRNTWSDTTAYDQQLSTLIKKFTDNFSQFEVSAKIRQSGPSMG